MCEITNGNIYVADKDIICYKLVKKTSIPGIYKPAVNGSRLSKFHYVEGGRYVEGGFSITGSDEVRECWVYNENKGGGMWYRNVFEVRNLEYYRKYLTECVFDDRETGCCMTDKGFYSYTYFMNGRMSSDIFWYCGFNKSININWVSYAVARCIIPKGAKYCVTDNGEVFVSDEIVFEKVLDIDTLDVDTQKTDYELPRFEY